MFETWKVLLYLEDDKGKTYTLYKWARELLERK